MWFLGESDNERKFYFNSFTNMTVIKFIFSPRSLWIYSQWFYQAEFWIEKTKSPNSLESLIRGSNLFLFGDNSCYCGEDGWFSLFITCGSLGSSFYNENVIKFISRLDSEYILRCLIKSKNCHFTPDKVYYLRVILDGKTELLVTYKNGASLLIRRP